MNILTPVLEPRPTTVDVLRPIEANSKILQAAIPLARPNAPKLSASSARLSEIENSHRLSNYGPVNAQFEEQLISRLFDGSGHCVTVCNATMGLILALKDAACRRQSGVGDLVLMPSFTFAAAAHAVLWAGLTPLLVDIDIDDWASSRDAELRMLKSYGRRIAAVMPYAAFGSCLDLDHYDDLSAQYGVPIIIDGAPSLGTLTPDGRGFGIGTKHTIVYSMHATKAFAVGEAGLVYSGDASTVERIRRMGNFGFDGSRSAVMAGLNSKISEVTALSALIKLGEFEQNAAHRMNLSSIYTDILKSYEFQVTHASRIAYQFMPVLLPEGLSSARDNIIEEASIQGIGLGKYFSPHIYDQPYFRPLCFRPEKLSVTDVVANRIVSLPVSDYLKPDDIRSVCSFMEDQVAVRLCLEDAGW